MAEATKKEAVAKKEKVKAPAKAAADSSTQFVSPALNAVLWIAAVVIVVAAIGGNYYYTQFVVIDESVVGRLVRVLSVIGTMLAGLALCLCTNKGRTLLEFAQKSYTELRKVIWPTRQEAMQTTFIVFIAVCVLSLFLYLCDVIFLQIVGLFI